MTTDETPTHHSTPDAPGIAVVTGAGSGIGAACALALAAAGWTVVIVGRNLDTLTEVAASAAGPGSLHPVVTDVSDEASVRQLFLTVVERFGRLDLLFNNAGRSSGTVAFDETPLELWQSVINVNLTGAFLCSREAFAVMRAQTPQGGRIINNGSVSAHVPRPGSAAYTASKHAISGLTKSIALDGRPFAIACGQLDIGNAQTPLTARMSAGIMQADGSMRAEPVMNVSAVANALLYMAGLPLEANVPSLMVMATTMPFGGRG